MITVAQWITPPPPPPVLSSASRCALIIPSVDTTRQTRLSHHTKLLPWSIFTHRIALDPGIVSRNRMNLRYRLGQWSKTSLLIEQAVLFFAIPKMTPHFYQHKSNHDSRINVGLQCHSPSSCVDIIDLVFSLLAPPPPPPPTLFADLF